MSDGEDEQHSPRGFGISIPREVVDALVHDHDRHRASGEERQLATLRWLDSLDVEGLMALRYVLMSDAEDAYANACRYDGMVYQLLRAKGVDPRTGRDPAAELLQHPDAPGAQ